MIFLFGLFSISLTLAQEIRPSGQPSEENGELIIAPEISSEVIADIELDENVEAEDLEIGEPTILPNHPLYFLKNWGRNIREFFTFNRLAKLELREKFANEILIELKKMVEESADSKAIQKAIEHYQKEIEKIKEKTEKIEEKAKDNPRIESFLDKFVKHQLLHQRLLQKLENQVPPEVFEKIKEARERHLERFAEVMTKLEDRKEKIRERIENKLEEIKGSKYKNFKNLEVLLELEEKVPEQAKESIRKAQENTLRRLKGDLEKMSSEDQEKFKEYLEKIGGIKEKQLEILENLRSELKEKPEIKDQIIQIRERIVEKIQQKAEKINCPEVNKPAPDFCREGRIIIKKDEKGCIISFECLIPAELEIPSEEKLEVCITLWDPVCGADGKTYSNLCYANLARTKVVYKGSCEAMECETDASCPQPRCGPANTISARCIGLEVKCIEGKCQTQTIPLQTEMLP